MIRGTLGYRSTPQRVSEDEEFQVHLQTRYEDCEHDGTRVQTTLSALDERHAL